MLDPVFDQFVKKSPISVMARGMMERVLDPQQLDQWFNKTTDQQYTRELLFSTVFDIMSQVVHGRHPSVHAAYQAKMKTSPFQSHRYTTSSMASNPTYQRIWCAMLQGR